MSWEPRGKALGSVAALLLSSLVCFTLAELGARAWAERYGNALNTTRSILHADANLLWKQRANLDTTFLSLPLRTNEAGWRDQPLRALASSSPLVLVLGPSSTFGWGVAEEDSYPAQLEKLLQNRGPAFVANAGEIGYSTAQGVPLFALEPAASLSPTAVVIAYGINDLDRNRFYFQSARTDREEFLVQRTAFAVHVMNILKRSALVDALLTGSSALRLRLSPPPLPAYPENPIPSVRVPLEDFSENMRALLSTARSRGATPILVGTVTDLPLSVPIREAQEKLAEAETLWQTDSGAARALLLAAVELDPHLCEAYYRLSSLAAYAGDIAEARMYFEKARQEEPHRIRRALPQYNDLLRDIAREEQVPFLDLEALFSGRPATELFVDPIHFSSAGNKLVAEGLEYILRSERLF